MLGLGLVNRHPYPVTLWLEPWGDAYTLLSEQTSDVVFYSTKCETLQIESTGEALIVWGWTGAYVSVWIDNYKVRDGLKGMYPVPSIP
jgi:hypothetical protein